MRNRLLSFILVVIVLFTVNSTIAYACDEQQTATYLGQLLFGNNAARWSSDDKMIMLVDALYLCSEQADGKGQDNTRPLHPIRRLSHESSLNLPKKKRNAVAMLRAMGRREFERARDTNLHLA